MRFVKGAFLLMVSACSVASPEFIGSEAKVVQGNHFTFHLSQSEESVEVIRVGYVPISRLGDVEREMSMVVVRETGCPAKARSGNDSARGVFDLAC